MHKSSKKLKQTSIENFFIKQNSFINKNDSNLKEEEQEENKLNHIETSSSSPRQFIEIITRATMNSNQEEIIKIESCGNTLSFEIKSIREKRKNRQDGCSNELTTEKSSIECMETVDSASDSGSVPSGLEVLSEENLLPCYYSDHEYWNMVSRLFDKYKRLISKQMIIQRRSSSSYFDLEGALIRILEEIFSFHTDKKTNLLDISWLKSYFYGHLSIDMKSTYLHDLIPFMMDLTLRMPDLFPLKQNLPILKQGVNHQIELTLKQIACLLSAAFFCLFDENRHTGFETPTINFSSLFKSYPDTNDLLFNQQCAKLDCIFYYFLEIKFGYDNYPSYSVDIPSTNLVIPVPKLDQKVVFKRVCIKEDRFPDWTMMASPLISSIELNKNGKIEETGSNFLQADFANMLVGGGVLTRGCVQEEIRFLINTECIVSRLFTEKLKENEVLIILNARQYNDYSGYGRYFRWKGPYFHHFHSTVDHYRTQSLSTFKETFKFDKIVCMDALFVPYYQKSSQFESKNVLRELNKAYVAFSTEVTNAVATGHWGCGAFNGNKKLKFMIQWMAASAAASRSTNSKRETVENEFRMKYFTFEDVEITAWINSFIENWKGKTVGKRSLNFILNRMFQTIF